MHWPGTVENLTERLQNITFIQKSIPVSHVVFEIKSTEKHATDFDKINPGTRQNSTVSYLPTLFYKRSCDLKKSLFLQC